MKSPNATWHVYDNDNDYRASCVNIEEAAVLVAFLGDGATIRATRSKKFTVWTEGREGYPASESYDMVARIVESRARAKFAEYEAYRKESAAHFKKTGRFLSFEPRPVEDGLHDPNP